MQPIKKIVLLGHFGVGKTSLIRQFVHSLFSEEYKVSIGVHISKKEVEVGNGRKIALIIWDLEGTEDLNKIRASDLMGAHGFFYVFDLTRPKTYINLSENLDFFQKGWPNVPVKVIGNKVDLVNEREVAKMLSSNKVTYDFLASAKTGVKVDAMFLEMANEV